MPLGLHITPDITLPHTFALACCIYLCCWFTLLTLPWVLCTRIVFLFSFPAPHWTPPVLLPCCWIFVDKFFGSFTVLRPFTFPTGYVAGPVVRTFAPFTTTYDCGLCLTLHTHTLPVRDGFGVTLPLPHTHLYACTGSWLLPTTVPYIYTRPTLPLHIYPFTLCTGSYTRYPHTLHTLHTLYLTVVASEHPHRPFCPFCIHTLQHSLLHIPDTHTHTLPHFTFRQTFTTHIPGWFIPTHSSVLD